jgi:ATP-dependent 26S proteasome regulatory subunit
MNTKIIFNFQKLIDVNTPIIYINDYDFVRVDELIEKAIGKKNVYEWNPATGGTHFITKEKRGEESLEGFLYQEYVRDAENLSETYFVLKEIDDFIEEPKVKSLLLHIAQRKLYDKAFNTTIIIVSSSLHIPQSLEKYVSFLEIDLPDEEEINELITKHIKVNHDDGFKDEDRQKLMPSLKGLSAFEIDRTLDMAMSSNGTLRAEDTSMILRQKKQMVKQSGLLELIDAKQSLDDIGGMEVLKNYLLNKAMVMSRIADVPKYGVQVPKGVFIVGMPGCGKSLCAKASAAAFNAPLLKLDMGSMMGKYVGESEGNLRKAIKIAEAAAPCILWIDEIEKAFSGVGGQNNDIVTRMFGYLLGWLQDKTSSVYVIATANNADNLPPELKRKGRFDEIFCVNLPSSKEREAIFKVHLNKKAKAERVSVNVEYSQLAKATEGFNGADIEAVVNETTEKCFLSVVKSENKQQSINITTSMLLDEAKNTVSISKSCKEQIDNMKKVFLASNFKDASALG